MATETVTLAPVMDSSRPSYSNELSDSVSFNQQRSERQREQDGVNIPQSTPTEDDTAPTPATEAKPFKPTKRFWLIMMSISAIHLCGAIEGTIVMNALPTIAASLGGGNLFLWVPNAFYLASLAVVPFHSQISDIFGRRNVLLCAMSLFVLGCALGGASTSMQMLIGARAIQGMGSGGADTLCETIVLDLVPLRERGKYMSIVAIPTTIGFAMGPFVGGLIVEKLGWPWVFYLSAIIGGFSVILSFIFLRTKRQRGQTFWSRFKRIDFGGNAIFVGAVVAVLLALTWAGPVYQWESAQILVPLILGLLGLCAFTAFEWTPRLAPEPSFPRILVSNRTSCAALAITIVNCITTVGTAYFLPVYFQGVLVKSPLESGVAFAPFAATIIPFCLVCGILLSKVGKYRPLHFVGWSAIIVSVGLCSTLNRHSSTAAWAGFQVLSAAGIGALTVSMLPAMQAPLSEREAASSAGMYIFARGFGNIWGITIPSAVFNNVVKHQATSDRPLFATNTTLAARLADGKAYQFATKAFLDSLPPEDGVVREQLIAIFERAIQVVFYVITAFAGLGLLLVLLEKEVSMRTENNTEFGLDEGDEGSNEVDTGDGGRDNAAEIAESAAAGRSQQSDDNDTQSRNITDIPLQEIRSHPASVVPLARLKFTS